MKSSDRLARYIPAAQLFSTRGVLFHQKIAERLGLSVTEYKCFRLVQQLGPMSATALAKEAGLQLGTVSPLVDKLEKLEFIARARDTLDRRRMVLVVNADAAARASLLFAEQGTAMRAYFDGYNERDFNLILSFLDDVSDILSQSLQGLLKAQSRGQGKSVPENVAS